MKWNFLLLYSFTLYLCVFFESNYLKKDDKMNSSVVVVVLLFSFLSRQLAHDLSRKLQWLDKIVMQMENMAKKILFIRFTVPFMFMFR